MKNKILILLFLLLQGICCVGFAQNTCESIEPQTPPEKPQLVPGPTSDSATIQSYQPLDPNEIIGLDGYNAPESTDTLRWVSATQSLAYTIYFENDAELAMAAASKVSITLPLHEKFNYATFGVGSFGFGSYVFAVEGSPSSYQTRIDLRDSMGIFLDVVAGLDIVHNEAFWIFQSIDPATGMPPTAINMGFLPINDSLHSGEGFVTFSIKPQTNDCLTGDTITATASIVFDVNEAIATNTWLNTVDAFPPTSTLHMVPNGADQLTATFSGEDDEGGCGIKQFKLYCSQNEGAYQLYGIYPVGTTPQILLETGVEYRFFVLAEDNVGNCEPMKSQPEFTIGTNFVTLAVNSFPAEAGSTTGAGTYSVNETAELTATAAEGYHFVHWMQQGAVVSTQDPYSLSVTQNQTYTAYFERDAYTLQTVAADGSVITVTDIYGNEIPSGSTIYHSDRLIVSTDTLSCYQMTSCLLNGNTYAPGDTLTINGDVQIVTQTVSNHDYTEFSEEVCESYTWNGITYIQSSDYTQTFTSTSGCDSVVTLHLTVHHATYGDTTAIACDSFDWYGTTYTSSGSYQSYQTNANGCDSIVTLHLTINHGDYAEVYVDTCGTEFFWEVSGQSYDRSDTYYYYSTNANACQDTNVLVLTLHQAAVTELAAQICEGDTYNQDGFNVSEAGDYEQHLQTVFGCDSTVILHLTVDNETVTNIAASICEGEDYVDNGFEIIAPAVGISEYSDTIHRQGTCDSIVVLHLTVNATTYGQETVTACDSFAWHGTTYTQSGDYTFTTTNAANCDSIVTLHLTVNATTYGQETVTACDSFAWHSTTYTQSGDYSFTTTNAANCDSIITLHLTINPTTYGQDTVTACDSFAWHDSTYTSSGSYLSYLTNANGCDSIVTLNLTINTTTYGQETVTACDSFAWHSTTYTQSGDYTFTTTNAANCDSIITLHLTINPTTYGQETVTACDSFSWHGTTYIQSGDYSFTTTNAANCDSIVTLHLTINHGDYAEVIVDTCGTEFFWEVSGQSYGYSDTYYYYSTSANACQDTTVLILTLHQSAVTELSAQICEGDIYSQNGFNVSEAGDYEQHLQTVFGCDSTVILHLTVDNETVTNIAASICEGEDYVDNGFEIIAPEAGVHEYSDTIHRHGTCDSIVVLHLTVNTAIYGQETVTACDSFAWHGTTYTQSGDYSFTTTNAANCDSIVTLHLTINPTTYGQETIAACDSFSWHGTTYTQSGDYTFTTTNSANCDSIVTLHLTVNTTTYGQETVTACDSFAWHGTTYTQSGDYTFTTTNAANCDSIVTLHLTINPTTYGQETVTACDSFAWHGTTYTQSGDYTFTTTNAANCDSIITLHLTINPITYGQETVTACDSFSWHGTTYTQSGDYTFTTTNAANCDSIVTLHLTIHHGDYAEVIVDTCGTEFFWEVSGQTYNHSDIYYHYSGSVNACQDTVALILVLHQVVATEFTAEICEGETYNQNGFNVSEAGDYQLNLQTVYGCDSTVTLHLSINEMPTLSMIEGDPIICRNQFSVYSYDMTDPDYNYYWYLNSQLLGGNEPSVVMHETVSGTYTLLMLVEDIQNNCQASTSISVLVQDAYAPDTTVIVRKNNTNILICSPVSSEYGTVHYRWGYTNRFTNEETVLYWDHNYCLFDIGIDQQSYLYWVETYIQYEDGMGCANRSYYGYSVYTDIADYELNSIDARIVDNQLVLHVNAASTDMIDVMLYGINGQLLMTQHYGYINQVDDILPFHYSNGMYLLIIRIGNQTYPVKLLKL